jgi:DNA processing protein
MTGSISASAKVRIAKIAVKVAPQLEQSSSIETDALDVFACAAWSGLGEPGDRMVRLLCDRLGARHALDVVISGMQASDIAREYFAEDENIEIESAVAEALDRWRPRLSESEAIAHLERAHRIGASLITDASALWPQRLNDLGEHRPIALWTRGNAQTLASLTQAVSMVGARASTGYGEHVTMELTAGLVDQGVAIVSGAAYGIDGMAHRAALASGGTTIAVLAGGIDRLYPSGHDALLQRIIETGLVLTELPCGFAPTKWRFLQRNRLIAAASEATVVVEAGWRSGSLNTAHHALELDRPLGVVPGPITSASSAGCHRLLRETPAVCVTSAEEILSLTHSPAGDAGMVLREDCLLYTSPSPRDES